MLTFHPDEPLLVGDVTILQDLEALGAVVTVATHQLPMSTGLDLATLATIIIVALAMTLATMVAQSTRATLHVTTVTMNPTPTLEHCPLRPVTTMTGTVTTDTDQVAAEVIDDIRLLLTHQTIHLTDTVEGPGLTLPAANTVAATTRQGDQGGG